MLTRSSVDGFPLAVQVSGRADGPALLLLPGQSNSHRWWDELRSDFDADFRVITFDYRGTGGSRGPVDRWTCTLFAGDAADALSAVGAESAAVYGTSMGGRVAQVLALDHPSRVDGLVLACTSPGSRNAFERSMQVRRALAHPDDGHRLETLRELFYTDAWPHAAAESPLFGDPTMTAEEARGHLHVSARHDAWDQLGSLAAPTLVLHGDDDEMVPTANAALLAERIPGALLRVSTGRHGFFDEFREEISPVVSGFLLEATVND